MIGPGFHLTAILAQPLSWLQNYVPQLSAAMRNLAIYLAAVATLHPTLAARYGAHFRDLLAFPKYEVQFLNDLPIAAADAARLQELGLDQEQEYMGWHPATGQDRRVGDGSESSARVRLAAFECTELIPGRTAWTSYP